MQKAFFLSLLSIFASTTSTAAAINGFYAGGTVGYIQSHVNNDYNDTFTYNVVDNDLQTRPFNTSISESNSTIMGGVLVGWQYAIKQLFITGLETSVHSEHIIDSMQYTITNPVSDEQNSTLYLESKVKLIENFDVLVKLGFLIQSKAIIYGLIGPTWGFFNVKNMVDVTETTPDLELEGTMEYDQKRYQVGLLLGLGLEYYFTNHFSFGLEYSHLDYGTLTMPASFNDSVEIPEENLSTVASARFAGNDQFDASYNNIFLKIYYHFG